mmetsp:Transcript_51557/g.116028  ORF Transcript_51557/g.116028 Transcript_51557/m.116028 type:complete len:202 (+) Transcript_51557:33-638(+)
MLMARVPAATASQAVPRSLPRAHEDGSPVVEGRVVAGQKLLWRVRQAQLGARHDLRGRGASPHAPEFMPVAALRRPGSPGAREPQVRLHQEQLRRLREVLIRRGETRVGGRLRLHHLGQCTERLCSALVRLEAARLRAPHPVRGVVHEISSVARVCLGCHVKARLVREGPLLEVCRKLPVDDVVSEGPRNVFARSSARGAV